MPAIRTTAREAFRQLLIDQNVLASGSIFLNKNDRINSAKLPAIRIRPSGGSSQRSAFDGLSDSFEDTYSLIFEIEVKDTASKDADTTLEELEEAVTAAIRTGSETLDNLLHDYQVTDSSYNFDGEGKDRIGNLSITVETMLKP